MDIDSALAAVLDFGPHAVPTSPVLPAGEQFTITELAEAYGTTTRALRFYEDHGLLAPERRGQARVYSRADFARLGWVLRGKRVGFSLADIRELLDLYDRQDGRARQRQKTVEKCRERLVALEAQRRDLDQMITELSGFCTELEKLLQKPSS
jgi:DNA-binding transcriptional MerR regulator